MLVPVVRQLYDTICKYLDEGKLKLRLSILFIETPAVVWLLSNVPVKFMEEMLLAEVCP
jgi:hypothetical protein